jgi:SAM-dependent methyltransferase
LREATQGVERAEYERMHEVEDRMWWYRGLRALAAQLLARALVGPQGEGPVLDAGCGTGGMLLKLGAAVSSRPTLGLEYDTLAAALATAKAARPVVVASVNEMPLGALPRWRRTGHCRQRGASLPRARWHRGVQSAGLWLAVVGA